MVFLRFRCGTWGILKISRLHGGKNRESAGPTDGQTVPPIGLHYYLDMYCIYNAMVF